MFTPSLRHPRAALLLISALLISPTQSRGETTPAPLSASVTIPTPAPAPPADRKSDSGAAVALAAVGAAMAGMSCMMLMKQAAEEEDESKKNMLMAMAMQQCGQAAQNAANAAKNDEGKKGLTSPAVAQPQLNAQAAPSAAPTQASADLKLPDATPTDSPVAEVTYTAVPAETSSGVAPATAFDSGLNTAIGDAKVANVAVGPGSTSPSLIPEARVGFDDSAKAGGAGDVAGAPDRFLGMNAGANAGPAANAAGAKDVNALLAAAGQNGRGGKKEGETHGEGSGSAGESNGKEGKSGDIDMNAMLAQIMGGGPAAAAPDAVTNGIINLKEFAKAGGAAGETEELPNIFQYASYRYRGLKKEGGLSDKKGKPSAAPGAVTVAMVNPVFKTPETIAVARGTASLASLAPIPRKAVSAKAGGKR